MAASPGDGAAAVSAPSPLGGQVNGCPLAGACEVSGCCNSFNAMFGVLCSISFLGAANSALLVATLTTISTKFGIAKSHMGIILSMDDFASLLLATPTAHSL
eukprot:gene5734-41443_t